jgi:hypothetical protein
MSSKWTVVQHSGFGYNGNPQFEQAVETTGGLTTAEAKLVEHVGGVVFDTYMEAEEFAEKANYPESNFGIIPTAKGTFSTRRINGLKIYIPVRSVTG